VAINPATPVELLEDALPAVDFVLLMSVNPGFAGQRFLPWVLDKAVRLRHMLEAQRARLGGRAVEIAMDGGVGRDNIRRLARAGVEMAVAGSAVFGSEDPAAAIAELRSGARTEAT
jgi:ribulose-phosphate 3-epimerase